MTLHETVDIIDNNKNNTIGKWGGGGVCGQVFVIYKCMLKVSLIQEIVLFLLLKDERVVVQVIH